MNINESRKDNVDLVSSTIGALAVTILWYALVFVADVHRPKALPSFPLAWTLLAGLLPCIGTIFAGLMLVMRRRGQRMNRALFYGSLVASMTPWLFWGFL